MDTGQILVLAGVGVWVVYHLSRRKRKSGGLSVVRVVNVRAQPRPSYFLNKLFIFLILVALFFFCAWVFREIPLPDARR